MTNSAKIYHLVNRLLPKRSKKWQQPGYLAIVLAPEDWETTRPLTPSCLAKDGAEIVWRREYADSRYSGPRSDHGQAWEEAHEEMARLAAERSAR